MATDRVEPEQSTDRKDLHLQLLDDIWLVTIFAVLLAIALPWFASGFDIDIGTAFWGVIALGAIHLALTAEAWLKRLRSVWRSIALALLQAIGVVVIGVIWNHAGGPQNPAFLLAFVFPVIGATFISRSQPYVIGVLAILVVTMVTLSQTAELRWYLTALGSSGAWLTALFGGSTQIDTPFRGFYAPYGFALVMLEAFAVLLLACAVVAEYLGRVFERLYANVESARAEAARGQELWSAIIECLPVPALLISTDTLQVICASEHVTPRFSQPGTQLAGRRLFEAITFSYPDVVQALVAGPGGVADAGMIRIGDELRAAAVHVQHIQHKGHRLALVILVDATVQYCTQAALDAADHAALVLDSYGRILAFNQPARTLFAGAELGAALKLFSHADSASPAPWWKPGLTGRRKMHVRVAGRLCQVTSSVVPLPGQEDSFYVVALYPMGRKADGSRGSEQSSEVTTTMAAPR